jgi:hypothetical protein
VWNNGDGTDVMNGDDGTDRIEDNPRRRRHLVARPENGRVRYDRTNAPFSLASARARCSELNTLGGNDTLATAPGTGIQVVAVPAPATTCSPARRTTRTRGVGDDNLNTAAERVSPTAATATPSIRDNAADLGAAAPAPMRRRRGDRRRRRPGRRDHRSPVVALAVGERRPRQDRQGQEGRRLAQAVLPGRHERLHRIGRR